MTGIDHDHERPEFYARFAKQLGQGVVGQEEAIRLAAVALVSQAHISARGGARNRQDASRPKPSRGL